MHQIRFPLGLRPRLRWGAYSARSPRPTSWIWGRFEAGGGLGYGRGGKGGRGGRGKWRGGKGSYCWTRAPQSLATPLVFIALRYA